VKGFEDTDGEATIVVDVDDVDDVVVVDDVSAACKGAPTVTVATLANTTTHSKTRILFIPKTDGYTNSPAGAAFIRISPLGNCLDKVGLTKRNGDMRLPGHAW
jgi:hypothetical protein